MDRRSVLKAASGLISGTVLIGKKTDQERDANTYRNRDLRYCFARVRLDERDLIQLLNLHLRSDGFTIELPRFGGGIPEDAWVETIYYDPAVRASFVVLWHESFPPVPPGEPIPILCTNPGLEKVVLRFEER